MIKLGDVRNVRDLGGWLCDGGTVKYGKMFRGGALYAESADLTISITEAEKQMCRNLLGIRHELDFRVSSEIPNKGVSTLGDDILYTNIPVAAITSNYAMMVDLDGSYKTQIKDILLTIFESTKLNDPLYFHCSYGADRTGVVAFIVNALLGVGQSDLDKDYELTSFYDLRPRTAAMYRGLIEYLKTCSNGSMRDCVVAWAVLLGISIDDINDFRRRMIDGTPETVSANINYACKGITLPETGGTIDIGVPTTVTANLVPSWATDDVTWTSNNDSVATVTGNGKTATITGVASGSAIITATCGGYSATYNVEVASLLPSGYTTLPYIEQPSSANTLAASAYADLGITGRTGLIIRGKAMTYDTADKYLVGSTNASSQRFLLGNASYIGSNVGSIKQGSITYLLTDVDSEFEFSTKVNDSYVLTNIPTQTSPTHTSSISNTNAFDNNVTMGLFCRNNAGTYQRFFYGRLYWLTVEENGEEIMNLLPCKRNSDNAVGVYDMVGGKFIASLNASVPFKAGA